MNFETQINHRNLERSFALLLALGLLLLVFVGFHPTFYLRPWFKNTGLALPLVGHGIIMTSWYVMLLVQTLLVRSAQWKWHRRMGFIGIAIGIAVIASGWTTAASTIVRAQLSGRDVLGNLNSYSDVFWSNVSPLVTFTLFFAIATATTRVPDCHRRYIWFASIAMLEPAMSRAWILPNITVGGELNLNTLVFTWGVMLFLPFAILAFDLITRRRIHVVTVIGIPLLVGLPKLVSTVVPHTTFGISVVKWLANAD